MDKQYFVDERGGCIAVRDRSKTDPGYSGLHADTDGVVRYWHGYLAENVCLACGHNLPYWALKDGDRESARALCDKLNQEYED